MSRSPLFQHVARPASKQNRKGLRYTIAYTFEKEGDTLSVQYGIAQCHAGIVGQVKADTYTRSEGRNISAERLASGPDGSPYAGKFIVTDGEGLSVARLIQDRFEAQRRAFMKRGRPVNVTVH